MLSDPDKGVKEAPVIVRLELHGVLLANELLHVGQFT